MILAKGDKAQSSALLSVQVRSRSGELVPLATIADVWEADWMGAAYSVGVFMIFVLLVVFIQQLLAEGMALDKTVVMAGAVRIKPILLTAVSAMVGTYFILGDPIFNGLAISLVFGLAMSTLFTVIVVPLLYYTLARCKWI
ncbi:efflux RND transporter permease subunit [Marinobacter sp. W-8]|uniref:efflux RND transporter permease subunit n=1 Tax=Marinobacter sp. W-8 TaxID=3369658 RepID=UPI0037C56CEC